MSDPTKSGSREILFWITLLPPVLWLAALLAQGYIPGAKLDVLLESVTSTLQQPFALQWTDRTAAFLLAAVLLYGLGISAYYATRGNTRLREEHGSARWGKAGQVNGKYADHKRPESNIILTRHVRLGMDGRKHRRNLNVLVVGGSGSGKTRYFAKPNVMQANCSYIIADPKAEMLRSVGPLLEAKGYDIKVFDLINMEQSDAYNPFAYLRDDKDALKLITNLIKNTTPKTAKSDEPFWEKAETALLTALILYLMHEAPAYEQNFAMIMYLLENAGASEESEDYRSPVDLVFEALEEESPEHIAVKQYKVFKQAAGKTAKSILVSAAVRLAAFNLPQIQRITSRDDMDLGSLGERKRAIFCVIPDNDSSFNYLVGMLYTQAFQLLYLQLIRVTQGHLMVSDFLNQKRRTVFKIDGIALGVWDRGVFGLFFFGREYLLYNLPHGFTFLGSKNIKSVMLFHLLPYVSGIINLCQSLPSVSKIIRCSLSLLGTSPLSAKRSHISFGAFTSVVTK